MNVGISSSRAQSFHSVLKRVCDIWVRKIIEHRIHALQEWLLYEKKRSFLLFLLPDGNFQALYMKRPRRCIKKAITPVLSLTRPARAKMQHLLTEERTALNGLPSTYPAVPALRRLIRIKILRGEFFGFYENLLLCEFRAVQDFFQSACGKIPFGELFQSALKQAVRQAIISNDPNRPYRVMERKLSNGDSIANPCW